MPRRGSAGRSDRRIDQLVIVVGHESLPRAAGSDERLPAITGREKRTWCPIWGTPATLLRHHKAAAVRRFNSPRAGGVYEISFLAEAILRRALLSEER